MCGVFFFFIALPDFYRMYHLHVLRLLLHRFRNVVRTRSQFHLVSPIALDIILFYHNAVYQFVLVSRVVLEIPFLVALSNDVQSCIFRSTRILFIFASHLHNKKTGVHAQIRREKQAWRAAMNFENLSRQETRKKGMYT